MEDCDDVDLPKHKDIKNFITPGPKPSLPLVASSKGFEEEKQMQDKIRNPGTTTTRQRKDAKRRHSPDPKLRSQFVSDVSLSNVKEHESNSNFISPHVKQSTMKEVLLPFQKSIN